MKLAISNIAWLPQNAQAAYRLMTEVGARGLEIAPALTFHSETDPFSPSRAAVRSLQKDLAAHEIVLVSMQSLLFGVAHARLFGDNEERTRFENALLRAIHLASELGIENIVFGSPANRRYPDIMSAQDAEQQAVDVFRRLGEASASVGVMLAIEPNPEAYGTNFITTFSSAVHFVNKVDHPGVSLNFDVGALIMNGEGNVDELVASANGCISHVHFSEPHLAPAPASTKRARRVVTALSHAGYDKWFSVEMRCPAQRGMALVGSALSRAAKALKN